MNIVIEAGPGSGKSTTLEQAFLYTLTGRYHFRPNQEQVNICHYVSTSFPGLSATQAVFIAFNTTTRDNLVSRLPSNCKAYTFNGLGQSLLFRRHHFQQFDNQRGQKLLSKLIGKNFTDIPYRDRLSYLSLLKYVSCCKEELLTPSPENFHFIQTKYNLQEPPTDIDLATRLITLMTVPSGSIEFMDQVWMGLQTIKAPIFEVAFVDEAQDLSALRLEFALRVARHCVFCGDPFQSINAFAGADHQAFEKLVSVSQYHLPLKESFRLPPNHIEYANTVRAARITAYKRLPGPIESIQLSELGTKLKNLLTGSIPHFQVKWKYNPKIYTTKPEPTPTPQPSAGSVFQGLDSNGHIIQPLSTPSPTPTPSSSPTIIHGVPYDPTTHLWTIPTPPQGKEAAEHLIIGRTNAEVFQVVIKLLKEGVTCKIIRRKEENDIFKTILWYLSDKRKTLRTPTLSALELAIKGDIKKASGMQYKSGSLLQEKAHCLLHLCSVANSIDEIPDVLERITAENLSGIRACTIHKAKGLEAHFIYILFPPVASPRAETPAEQEQEKNLEFVSETRSQFYKAYVK